MKNKQLMSGIFVLLISLPCSCKKDKRPEFVNMTFEIPFSITPIKDTNTIGNDISFKISCPDCKKGDQVVPIYYGYPSSKTMEKIEQGQAVTGGCIISATTPQWHCKRDHSEF